MKDKIPDRRAMEKITSDLSRLLQGQDFKSEEDLKAYLDNIVKGGKIPDASPKSAVSFAQDIIYEAWEAKTKRERIKLAKEALSISPDCADAYNLLAEEEAKTLKEAKELYQKGMEAGRRALGEEIFKEETVGISGDIRRHGRICVRAPGLWNACGSWENMTKRLAMPRKCSS